MYYKRLIYSNLMLWKQDVYHKPLVLRGARQVGKTTLVRDFAHEFTQYIELNLEKPSDRKIFDLEEIKDILNAIFLLKKKDPSIKDTLILIDEIQEEPRAIQMLRYFYEEYPDYYIIASGSLLEFALKKVKNFPVGRIEYLYLHPFNFMEYVLAHHGAMALNALHEIPFPRHLNEIYFDWYHDYVITGGMPEIIKKLIEDNGLLSLTKTYNSIWSTYKDDAEKYAQNNTYKNIIRHIMDAAPHESDRIKFEHFGNSNYKSREVGECFRALDMAKIIRLIYPTTSIEPPLSTDLKKRPRLQWLDIGLLNFSLRIQGELIGIKDLNDIYKGRIIQHLVNQEIISLHATENYKPHFWVREEKDTSSELDLVVQHGKYLIPIEIKSGKSGALKSLHQFIDRSVHPYAVRLYAGNISVDYATTAIKKTPYLLLNLPYFLSTKLPEYIKWFVENHTLEKHQN